jgi:VanZ family protein
MMMPLGLLAGTYALRTRPIGRALLWATLLGFGSSVSVEFLQCFLPYRTPSLSDISLNTLGTLAGAVVAVYLVHRETARVSGPTRESERDGI